MLSHTWTEDELVLALGDRYGLLAISVSAEEQPGPKVMTWRVERDDGDPVRVTQYLDPAQLAQEATALDMAEYCRAAGLAVPRVWADSSEFLLSNDSIHGVHGACAVVDLPAGKPFIRPFTVAQAQHLGLSLGLMHRVLAAYPPPTPAPLSPETAWADLAVDAASAVHEAAAHAAVTAGARSSQASTHLNWIQQCLTRHAAVLRAEIPRRGRLTAYAIHGAFVPPNVRAETGRPVITGFRARHGYLAWELGRVAFDVRTVAEGNDWQECAVALLSAYRCAYPALPAQELTASSRIALLEMLCAPVMSALPMAWELRAEAVRRLLDALPDLDEALRLCDGPMRQ